MIKIRTDKQKSRRLITNAVGKISLIFDFVKIRLKKGCDHNGKPKEHGG